MSLGGSGSKDGTCDANGYHPDPDNPDSLHEAICNATNEGVVFSVAAGNDDADAENSAPAAYDDTFASIERADGRPPDGNRYLASAAARRVV